MASYLALDKIPPAASGPIGFTLDSTTVSSSLSETILQLSKYTQGFILDIPHIVGHRPWHSAWLTRPIIGFLEFRID